MTHAGDERLILAHFEGDRAVTKHLATCLSCRSRMASIQKVLASVEAAPVPERGEAYGREVWRRIAPRLPEPEPSWKRFFSPPRLAAAAALAAVAFAAFLSGRLTTRPEPAPAPAASRAGERILLAAVGDHLERSQAVLIELLHSPSGGPEAAHESARAEELLAANRIYRLSAASAGQRALSDVLEDLERVLQEIAHAPAHAPAGEAASLGRRSEAEGVLFKIRVLGTRVREREIAIDPRTERKRT